MSRRKATQDDVASDEPLLSPEQELAADLLATGASVTAAAEACGVARQTVSEWLNSTTHSERFKPSAPGALDRERRPRTLVSAQGTGRACGRARWREAPRGGRPYRKGCRLVRSVITGRADGPKGA